MGKARGNDSLKGADEGKRGELEQGNRDAEKKAEIEKEMRIEKEKSQEVMSAGSKTSGIGKQIVDSNRESSVSAAQISRLKSTMSHEDLKQAEMSEKLDKLNPNSTESNAATFYSLEQQKLDSHKRTDFKNSKSKLAKVQNYKIVGQKIMDTIKSYDTASVVKNELKSQHDGSKSSGKIQVDPQDTRRALKRRKNNSTWLSEFPMPQHEQNGWVYRDRRLRKPSIKNYLKGNNLLTEKKPDPNEDDDENDGDGYGADGNSEDSILEEHQGENPTQGQGKNGFKASPRNSINSDTDSDNPNDPEDPFKL